MGASKEASQWGKGAPILPKLPAFCLRWAGPVPPGSVPSGSFPAPLPPHLSKGSMQKGAIWSFVDTFSPVQYLPGVNAGPGSPESAVPPLPRGLIPPLPTHGVTGCGGKLTKLGSPAESGRVRSLLVTPTHILAQKTVEVECLKVRSLFSMNLLCLILSTNSNLIASGLKPLQ